MAAELSINLKKRFKPGKKVDADDMYALIDSMRNKTIKVPAADVNGLADMIAGAMGAERTVGLSFVPPGGVGDGYYVPLEPGVYWNFSTRAATFWTLVIVTNDDSPWNLSEITSIALRNTITDVLTPIALVKNGTYWTFDNDIASEAGQNYARSTTVLPIDFFTYKIEVITTNSKLQFDVKFMQGETVGATFHSRTAWTLDFNTEGQAPVNNFLEIIAGEVAMFYGSPENGFVKINSRLYEDASKKVDYISIAPTSEKYTSEKAVDALVKDLLPADIVNVNAAGTDNNPNLMNLTIRRSSDGVFALSDIKELRIINDLGDIIIVSLVMDSYWSNDGSFSGWPNWARSDMQFPIAGRVVSVELDLNSPITDFIFDLKFMKGTNQINRTMWLVGFGKKITVGKTDYTNVSTFVAEEPAARKDVYVKGVINELNPNIHFKNGSNIIGEGMGKTVLRISFNTPWTGPRGIYAEADVTIRDLTIETIHDNMTGYGEYALHIDADTGFKLSHALRVHFKSILNNPEYPNPEPGAGLAVGIGFHDGQRVLLEDCIIEGQNVVYGSKFAANTHNRVSIYPEIVPGNICFKSCTAIGPIHIADVNASPDNDGIRPQGLIELHSCTFDVIKLKSFWATGPAGPGGPAGQQSPNRKNGLKFNVSGSSYKLISGANDLVDTTLPNYGPTCLPMFPGIEFYKNAGAVNIAAGDAVCFVYDFRKYHWYDNETWYKVPVAVEKLNGTNYMNFAGFSLVDSAAGNFLHVVTKGMAITNNTVGLVNDVLSIDSSGTGQFVVSAARFVCKVFGKDPITGKTILRIY